MFNDWTPVVHIVFKVSTEGSSDKMSNMDPIILLLIFDIAINQNRGFPLLNFFFIICLQYKLGPIILIPMQRVFLAC